MAERVLPEFGAALEERDVEAEPELAARYRLEIPVLLLGAREVARHRISEADLRERLIGMGLALRR